MSHAHANAGHPLLKGSWELALEILIALCAMFLIASCLVGMYRMMHPVVPTVIVCTPNGCGQHDLKALK